MSVLGMWSLSAFLRMLWVKSVLWLEREWIVWLLMISSFEIFPDWAMWDMCLGADCLRLQACEERIRSMLYKLIKYSKQVYMGHWFFWYPSTNGAVWSFDLSLLLLCSLWAMGIVIPLEDVTMPEIFPF